jgi:hypothetical protein
MRRKNRQPHGKFEYRSCKSKKRFKSEFDAAKAGSRLGLREYECHICKGWHLTSQVG